MLGDVREMERREWHALLQNKIKQKKKKEVFLRKDRTAVDVYLAACGNIHTICSCYSPRRPPFCAWWSRKRRHLPVSAFCMVWRRGSPDFYEREEEK